MLESEFQTADARRHDFPWRTLALCGLILFLAGALSLYAIESWRSLGIMHAGWGIVVAAMLVMQTWRFCRSAVRSWQHQFGRDVEYVARRVREHQAGFRFQDT